MFVYPKSAKDQILSLIKTVGPLSIPEMAFHLDITEMAVRRHIQTLEREAIVETAAQKPTKGRPSKLYQLSGKGEELFPKKYKQLSIELLNELAEMGQESLITEILTRRKNRLLEQYRNPASDKSFSERLEALKRIQGTEGFMPEITKENDKIHFKEYNCPYIETASEYRQICTSEKDFIQDFLETDAIEVKSCIASGDRCCHYIINQN